MSMMPGVDGITVCKTVRHDPNMERMPIIMMSASRSAIQQAKSCGDAVLSKPFDLDRLLNTVHDCIQAN